jgi:hypothetical protein
VTEKASIAGRSLFVTLLALALALALALVFVATSAGDADAKRVRHKKSTAAFINCVDRGPTPCDGPNREDDNGRPLGVSEPFTPPDRFSCRYLSVGVPLDQTLDGYRCRGGTTTFLLDDVLKRNGNPPFPGSEDPLLGVAVPPPVSFKCRSDGNAPSLPPDDPERGATLAAHFNCQSRQNQQTFKVNEIVSTTLDEEGPTPSPTDDVDGKGDVWLPPGPDTTTPTPTPKPTAKPTATKTPAAVPTAVPAGTDAAGGDSAAGLVGLVLAAGGAVAGGAVMARRRFMHDS